MCIRDSFEPVELQLAMAAMFLRPHDLDAAQDAPARLVGMEEEGGEAVAGIVRGAGDQDEVLGLFRAGDEPFAAADDVLVAAPLGLRPVSYTHLDVYKRQRLYCASLMF